MSHVKRKLLDFMGHMEKFGVISVQRGAQKK